MKCYSKQLDNYQYMLSLQKIFNDPKNLVKSRHIPLPRRRYLLKRWHDDRQKFLYENCTDMDYMRDHEMELLLASVSVINDIIAEQRAQS